MLEVIFDNLFLPHFLCSIFRLSKNVIAIDCYVTLLQLLDFVQTVGIWGFPVSIMFDE